MPVSSDILRRPIPSGQESEVPLRKIACAVTCLALGLGFGVRADASGDYERTIEVGSRPIDVRLHYGAAAPGSSAIAGEGLLATPLPGTGRLTLRLPHTFGEVSTLGAPQLAASYDLAPRPDLLPRFGVAALVNVPEVAGTRTALPGVRASAQREIGTRFLQSFHVESELRTEGPTLAPSARTRVGARFRLPAALRGTLELVTVRPSSSAATPRENLAQLGLARAFGRDATLQLGVGGGRTGDAASLRTRLGVDLRF